MIYGALAESKDDIYYVKSKAYESSYLGSMKLAILSFDANDDGIQGTTERQAEAPQARLMR